jgi:hypothetical protein
MRTPTVARFLPVLGMALRARCASTFRLDIDISVWIYRGMSIKLPGLHTELPTRRRMAPQPTRPLLFVEPDRIACAEPKRRRLWELSGNFHCSIIGTCLTTAELRHILTKILPGA